MNISAVAVTVLWLAVSKYSKASFVNDPNGRELILGEKVLATESLNRKLEWALIEAGLPLPDACTIVSESAIARMDMVRLVKEAIREEYGYILICIQSKAFIGDAIPQKYHWLYALSFKKSWFQEELWEWAEFDWGAHFDEILRADNVEFFKHICDMNLAPPAPSRDKLEDLDAAKIMQYLNMEISSDEVSIREHVCRKRVNTLRQLYENGIDILREPWMLWGFADADILDFGLSIKPDIVSSQIIARDAVEFGKLESLKVLHRRCGTFPLDQEHLTIAAGNGFLAILLWAHSLNPSLRPTKECLPKIMIKGYKGVFEFLHFYDKELLPEPYCEKRENERTMWHYNMIPKLYYIAPERVPLELLYLHAMRLCHRKTVVWTSGKIQQDIGKTVPPTDENLRRAIARCSWSLVRWILEKVPTMLPSGGTIRSLMMNHFRIYNERKNRIKFVLFLRYLYNWKPICEYLPTVDELRDLPVEFVQWVHGQNADYLSTADLMALCASRKVGIDIYEWVCDGLHMELNYSKMANEAAKVGNISALKWIIARDPAAFPSKQAILARLKNRYGDLELLNWVYSSGLERLPNWESLELLNYHLDAPEIMQELKAYQEEQRKRLRAVESLL
jgi:hypothetical protein